MPPNTRPGRDEAADYYFTYIDKVGEGNILEILRSQQLEAIRFLATISEEQSTTRSNPEQWSARQVWNHVNDGERLFVFRAVWFARGFDSPLPGFDQNIAVEYARADDYSWNSHIEEFRTIRAATNTFFANLPEAAWTRTGTASDYPFTVKALAYIVAGHCEHHLLKLKERFPRTV
ncbi:MAG: DinB family protein [Gemmatales bacterium]